MDQDLQVVLNLEAGRHLPLDPAVATQNNNLEAVAQATQSSNLEAVAQALDQASVSPKQYQIIWQELQELEDSANPRHPLIILAPATLESLQLEALLEQEPVDLQGLNLDQVDSASPTQEDLAPVQLVEEDL